MANIADLVRATSRLNERDSIAFERYLAEARDKARAIWLDRSISYNEDSSASDDMPYGIVSLASEIFKRAKRAKSLMSPVRPGALRKEDIDRMEDTALDLMNYGAWLYALVNIAQDNVNMDVSQDREATEPVAPYVFPHVAEAARPRTSEQ